MLLIIWRVINRRRWDAIAGSSSKKGHGDTSGGGEEIDILKFRVDPSEKMRDRRYIRCDSPERDLEGYDSPYSGTDLDPDDEIVSGGLPAGCLWEVLRRLQPAGLLAAAGVCKGWREKTKRLWRAVEELRLMVPSRGQLRFMGLVLKKRPSFVRLALKMERFGSKPTFDRSNPLLVGSNQQMGFLFSSFWVETLIKNQQRGGVGIAGEVGGRDGGGCR
ncbi:hypothetical protein GQ457_14G022760 [Hibiscus cannabinus]